MVFSQFDSLFDVAAIRNLLFDAIQFLAGDPPAESRTGNFKRPSRRLNGLFFCDLHRLSAAGRLSG